MSVGFRSQGSLRLGALGGIELRVHALCAVWVGLHLLESPDRLAALSFDLLLFGSMLLHELGHCLGARAAGGQAQAIVLYPFGGASLLRLPHRAGAELLATALGPLVNLALAGLALALAWALGELGALAHPAAALGFASEAGAPADATTRLLCAAALINAALFAFNVIPAYPVDGGRLLRAGLWPLIGWRRATVLTTLLGLLLAAACGVAAGALGEVPLLLVAAFVGVASWLELQRALAASDAPPAPAAS